ELETHPLREIKRARQSEIQRTHCRTIQRVAAYIAVGKRKGRRERRRIEPFFGGVRSGSVNRLPRIVGTNWAFTENSPRISRISKTRTRNCNPQLILV